jgi:hypothetical protein
MSIPIKLIALIVALFAGQSSQAQGLMPSFESNITSTTSRAISGSGLSPAPGRRTSISFGKLTTPPPDLPHSLRPACEQSFGQTRSA